MLIIKAYKCEFCPRGNAYLSKSSCEKHEARCFYNPDSHSCATCRFKGSRAVQAPGKIQKIAPGCVAREYFCQAKKPGKCLTTDCPSWKLQKPEVSL